MNRGLTVAIIIFNPRKNRWEKIKENTKKFEVEKTSPGGPQRENRRAAIRR